MTKFLCRKYSHELVGIMKLRISKFLTTEIKNILLRNIYTGRCLCKTHYEVLKLPKNCSTKEIRSAFIKLSKEYHPDKNIENINTHTLFVQLNEAYTVLSRPDTRRAYDLSLIPRRTESSSSRSMYEVHPNTSGYNDPTFWQNRGRSKSYPDRPYYGIKGIKKMSNRWIVVFCFIFAVVGVGLQVVLIRESVSFSRRSLDEQSQKNAQVYAMAREKAMGEGKQIMFERINRNVDIYENRNKTPAKEEDN